MPPKPEVSAQIDAMKAELGVDLDRELAHRLGIDPSSIAAWRRRGSVPDKYLLSHRRASDERLVSSTITGPMGVSARRLREGYLFMLIDKVANKPIDPLMQDLPAQWLSLWRGLRLANAYSYFKDMVPETDDKDQLREAYEKLQDEINTSDFLIWLESI